MAANSFPDDGPKGGRVDLGCHGPIGPRSGLALNSVDHRRQLAKGGLIGFPLVFSPCQEVEFCNAVRRKRIRLRSIINAVSAIGGAYGGGGRELGNGDVVRVPIGSLRTEGDDYIGSNAPDVPYDSSDGSARRDFINSAVRKA